jgi:hypothetical protein
MAFQFNAGTISPGQEIRLFYQFNAYTFSGSKVFQASPTNIESFLIAADVGHELRPGVFGSGGPLYVYSVTVKNIGPVVTGFNIVGGDVV